MFPAAITVSDGNSGNNYAVTYNNYNAGTISPKVLTVSGLYAPGKIYDGTTNATVGGTPAFITPSDPPGGGSTSDGTPYSVDSVSPGGTPTGAFATPYVGTNKTVTVTGVTVTGTGSGNYTAAQPSLSANITNLVVALTGSKNYDGTTTVAANNLSITNNHDGANLTLSGSATLSSRNVGGSVAIVSAAGLTLGGSMATNYTLAGASGSATVAATNLTVTAAPNTKTYDGTTSATNTPTITVGSIQAGDTAPVWTEAYDTPSAGTGKALIPAALVVNDGNYGTNYNYTYATNFAGVINALASTTLLGADINPSVLATRVTFTATVSGVLPAATLPTGNVVFLANGTPFATNGPLVPGTSSGSISASTTSLPVGTNTITAQYLGNGNFQPSTSAALAQVVTNWGAVAITNQVANVTNCAGMPAIFTVEATGNNLTYQWQVSGDGGTTFTNVSATATNASYTNLATTVAENGYLYQVIVSGSGGPTGTLSVTSAPPAVLIVYAPATASAGGNQTICAGSSTAALGGTVGGSATGGTWTTSGSGTFTPDATTLNATYVPSAGDVTAGTVTLTLTSTGQVAPCPAAATAQVVVTINKAPTASAGGSQTICAGSSTAGLGGMVAGSATGGTWTTSGSGTFTPNATTLNATYVPSAGDATAGTATLTLSSTGQPASCPAATAQVVVTINKAATAGAGGNQTVYSDRSTAGLGGTVGGGATGGIWSSSGTGTFSPGGTALNAIYYPSAADVSAGSVTLTLTTTGQLAPCPAATAQVVVTIVPAAPTVTVLGGVATPQPYGSTLLTATVTTNGVGAVGTGFVTFVATGTNLATVQLTNGFASLSTNLGAPGSPYAIQAVFNDPTGEYDSSFSGTSNVTITARTVTLAGSKTYDGRSTIAGSSLSVVNNLDGANLSLSGSAALSSRNVGGAVAILSTAGLTLGGSMATNYTLAGATGSVTVAATNLTLTAAPNTKAYDGTTSATNTPTITAGSIQVGDTAPAWTETYDTPSTGTGKTLTPAALTVSDGNGGANYSYTYVAEPVGEIDPLGTTTLLAADINPSVLATRVTFTATVSGVLPAATLPTGNVVFLANGTPFATNGPLVASTGSISASTASLPVGTNAITAQYLGNGNFQPSTSAAFAQVVANWGAVAITNQVANVTNCAGTPAIFTVEAIGNNLIYQWEVSGDGGTTFTNVSATATNASYTNLATTVAENGYLYQVIVSGSAGASGTLSVTSMPPAELIVKTPATASAGGNQTICAGSSTAALGGTVGGSATGGAWTTSGSGTFTPDATTLNATYIPSAGDITAGTVTLTLISTGQLAPCPAATAQVVVTINKPATASAGGSQTICGGSSTAALGGAVGGSATGGTWTTSGSGTFTPDATTLNATYVPSAGDATAGTVTLTLTSTGQVAPCPAAATAQVVVTINKPATAGTGGNQTICAGSNTAPLGGTVSGSATGGTWTTSGSGTFTPSATTLNATYVPSAGDVTAGTVTLTLTSTGQVVPCTAAAMAQVVVTISKLATASAGGTQTICGNGSTAALGGTVGGSATGGTWTTSGSGTFSPSATTLNAIYVPSAGDATVGTVTLTLTSTGQPASCTAAMAQVVVTINKAATAGTGGNQTIYSDRSTTGLGGTVGGGATGGIWSSSGTGVFSPNATTLNAIYHQSAADVSAGSVTLTLTSTGQLAPCPAATAQVVVTIVPQASTVTALGGVATPQPYGSTLLTATVTTNGVGAVTTGIVTFTASGTNLASVQLTNGFASLSTNLGVPGSPYAIQAVFNDPTGEYYGSSSGTSNVTITARTVALAGSKTYDKTAVITPGTGLTVSPDYDGANVYLAPSTGVATLAGWNAGPETITSVTTTVTNIASITTNFNYNTPTRVQYAGSTGGSWSSIQAASFSVTLTNSTSAGNTLVAVINTDSDGTNRVSGVSGAGAASWTQLGQAENGTSAAWGSETEMWYAPNVSGGNKSVTITLNTTANLTAFLIAEAVVMEYTNLVTAPLDVHTSSSGGTSPASTGTTSTTAQSCEVWVAGLGTANSSGYVTLSGQSSGWNLINSQAMNTTLSGTGTYNTIYAYDHIATNSGPAVCSATESGGTAWAGVIGTFKATLGYPTYIYTTNYATTTNYNFALAGAAATNYTLVYTGAVTINPYPVTVAATSASKIYDGTTTAGGSATVTPSGGTLIGTDTYSPASPGESFTSRNVAVGSAVVVPAAIAVSDGNGGANYSVTYSNYTGGTISARPLTVTAATATKLYDGTTNTTTLATITAGSIQAGDSPPASGWTEAYGSRNAGSGKTLSPAHLVVNDGNGGANYSYTYGSVTTGVIDPDQPDGDRGPQHEALRRHDQRRGHAHHHGGQHPDRRHGASVDGDLRHARTRAPARR